MSGASRSLMDFIAAPVLVGDPDGRVVYVNPAFEEDFSVTVEGVSGQPLANFFEGGGREAVLSAVARVCTQGSSARFRLRVGERGYGALASPVEAEGGRVGVILLLTDEPVGEDRLQSFRREISESLDELSSSLSALAEQTAELGDDKVTMSIADAIRAIERIRKWAESVAARLGRTR